MSDGLEALAKQRERARTSARTIPPSRSVRKTDRQPDGPSIIPGKTDTALTEPEPSTSLKRDADAGPAAPAAEMATETSDELTRSSIYLDAAADDYLEAVRRVGRKSKPKVDASRSAVVRLALARLSSELTPEEALAELRKRVAESKQTLGRKRL
ncbi:MAG: hypothetical protein JWN95_1371 [Frankiales bacterium]|nr:hypothetical protein [Frankiales bacterium]